MILFLIEHFIIYNLFFIDTESCQEFNQENFQILTASNSHYVTRDLFSVTINLMVTCSVLQSI
jgi:hypothetical protein